MKKNIKFLIATAFALVVNGCVGAMPNYKSSNSSMIVFKTPTVRYADQGFVSYASNETKVEIYSNGQAVMRLRITPTQTCLSSFECMDNKEFNQKVLNANYPENTLENIFKGEPIFNSKGLIKTANGFKQQFDSITYIVNGGNIKFVDRKRGIKIKVTKL